MAGREDRGCKPGARGGLKLIPIADPSVMDPRLVAFHAYWKARCRNGSPPRRSDIDPLLEIPALAPDLFMLDKVADRRRYVVRLAGTRIVERYGADTTGQPIVGLTSGRYKDALVALLDATAETQKPVHSLTNYLHPTRSYMTVERLMVPLVDDEGRTAILLVCQLFHDSKQMERANLRDVTLEVQNLDAGFRFTAHTL